jgi:DNA processing protein
LNIATVQLESYPASLKDLSQPPSPLFMLGDNSLLNAPLIGVVGTREPTQYGLRIATLLSRALSRGGACVVSGMARGIDAAAHRAALDQPGKTLAVLGTGIDVPYPVGNRDLHRAISEKGLVISESGPGLGARKGAFPKRNRIIAALCPVTIVVEAGDKSGAINTANQATDLGRTVAAVPGPIDSPQSIGTNRLIRDGATVIASIDDALSLVGLTPSAPAPPYHLSELDATVWNAISRGPLSVDAICDKTNLRARDALTAVTSLELQGMVESLLTGEVRRRAGR